MLVVRRIVNGLRGRSQFEDERRVEPGQRTEREFAAAVVRLVHDHHRTVKPQQVRQRGDGAACALHHVQRSSLLIGQVLEVIHERACVFIDLQAFGIFPAAFVFTAKRLDCRDDHYGPAGGVGAGHRQRLCLGHDSEVAIEILGKRGVVRVSLQFERLDGLVKDCSRRYEPQNHRIRNLKEIARGDPYGMRGHQRLAASGRHTQTDIRRALSNGRRSYKRDTCGLAEGYIRAKRDGILQVG